MILYRYTHRFNLIKYETHIIYILYIHIRVTDKLTGRLKSRTRNGLEIFRPQAHGVAIHGLSPSVGSAVFCGE